MPNIATRTNCWEYIGCGREPGGAHTGELGVCPAATDALSDGVNHGRAGGRFCWTLVGTLCGGEVQGTHAAKLKYCFACSFYRMVEEEEDRFFKLKR